MAVLINRTQNNFTMISNNILRDKELSMKDRGVLCTICSLPDGWEFSIEGLCSIVPDGKDSIRNSVRKSEKLVSLNEKIETLYKSDLIIKQNEELSEAIQNTKSEATATIAAANEYLAAKEKELSKRLWRASQSEQAALELESNFQNKLSKEAQQLTEKSRMEVKRQYEECAKKAEMLFKNQTRFFYGVTICSILYGFIVTFLTAINSDRFSKDLTEFLSAIGVLLSGPFKLALKACQLVWNIKTLISIDILNTVIAILSVVIVFLLINGLIYGICGYLIYRFGKFYYKEFWDSISAAVALISLAMIVWFADELTWVNINLLGIWLMIHLICQYDKRQRKFSTVMCS